MSVLWSWTFWRDFTSEIYTSCFFCRINDFGIVVVYSFCCCCCCPFQDMRKIILTHFKMWQSKNVEWSLQPKILDCFFFGLCVCYFNIVQQLREWTLHIFYCVALASFTINVWDKDFYVCLFFLAAGAAGAATPFIFQKIFYPYHVTLDDTFKA